MSVQRAPGADTTTSSPGDGLLNFREVGGLRTSAGGRIRSGLLFRSDDLGALDSEAWRDLQSELGLMTAIDLRSGFEGSLLGDLTASGGSAVLHRVPILSGSMMEAASRGELTLSAMYEAIAVESVKDIVAAISLLGQPAALPGVVFCSFGKDRTGILVALLLDAVGVLRSEIIADYALSTAGVQLFERMSHRSAGKAPSVPAEMLQAPPHAISDLLDAIDDRFGSAREFLLRNGLSPALLANLRHRLVE